MREHGTSTKENDSKIINNSLLRILPEQLEHNRYKHCL